MIIEVRMYSLPIIWQQPVRAFFAISPLFEVYKEIEGPGHWREITTVPTGYHVMPQLVYIRLV